MSVRYYVVPGLPLGAPTADFKPMVQVSTRHGPHSRALGCEAVDVKIQVAAVKSPQLPPPGMVAGMVVARTLARPRTRARLRAYALPLRAHARPLRKYARAGEDGPDRERRRAAQRVKA